MWDVALQVAVVAQSGARLLPWWAWLLIALVALAGLVVWIQGWKTDIDSYN